MFTGNDALPVSADAVMFPLAPTFTVATAKAPMPFVPRMFTMPSLVVVAANATMSGTGVAEAESSKRVQPCIDRRRLSIRAVKAQLHIGRCHWGSGCYGKNKTLRRSFSNICRYVWTADDSVSGRIGGLVGEGGGNVCNRRYSTIHRRPWTQIDNGRKGCGRNAYLNRPATR